MWNTEKLEWKEEDKERGQQCRQRWWVLIGFRGLFSIVSEDVTLSTEEAEARCETPLWCGQEIFVCAVSHTEKSGD